MHIETIPVGHFVMNCYLLSDPQTSSAVLIDPGAEADKLIERIESQNLTLEFIINTHCHIDHIADAARIQKHFKTKFYIHEEELPLLEFLPAQSIQFGVKLSGLPHVDKFLHDGHELIFGSIKGKVLFTPGHSPGGISVLFEDNVFVGDCLFRDSVGRTDLYGGDYDVLMNSIKEKLLSLPDNVIVYPGHGPATTIGRERKLNPFLLNFGT